MEIIGKAEGCPLLYQLFLLQIRKKKTRTKKFSNYILILKQPNFILLDTPSAIPIISIANQEKKKTRPKTVLKLHFNKQPTFIFLGCPIK